ncbi:hypothetical protein HanRHA438_Chr13g0608301 [Helianthus annuus]|nr:hypothetical protein HanIR_Chr13g0650261 [Helianthus annuus]KAJ0859074.1 hypothetical protein HanRHA438_Chr13g0608301 [Helianthus annuus]
MGQNGFGSKRVRVQTGQLQKRVVLVRVGTGSGRNGFGSERVRVETGSGQNGFRVGLVKNCFLLKKRDCTLKKPKRNKKLRGSKPIRNETEKNIKTKQKIKRTETKPNKRPNRNKKTETEPKHKKTEKIETDPK